MKFCQEFKPAKILSNKIYAGRPISISLSPNTEKDDVDLALKLIFQPWKWKKGKAIEELENQFEEYLGVKLAFAKASAGKYAISFNSGRSGLMAILRAMEIKESDEILLQAFTCNSAVNPILNLGAKPVFVDIDETINLDPENLKKKITSKSRAVMIQNTFGWPAKIDEIFKIARENNLYLIEDCAHSLGAKYKGKFCGTFGDTAFFSFGRDKIISSVFGGMVVTNDEKMGERIKKFQEKLDFPSNLWIFQQLLHPILTNYLVLPAYGLNNTLGRIILGLFHVFSILSKGVYKKEKKGKIPKYFPKKLPNALVILALNQFKKLERFNEHRREIAKFYENKLKNTKLVLPLAKSRENIAPTFMRYPILTNFDTDEMLQEARKRKIYLDDGWRKTPIVPPDTDISKMKYTLGTCPHAEKLSKMIVNLPTHINISKKDAEKIVDFLKNYGN
jgi:dTDP-4-amino-4,6-dideoxygalactose transaminase